MVQIKQSTPFRRRHSEKMADAVQSTKRKSQIPNDNPAAAGQRRICNRGVRSSDPQRIDHIEIATLSQGIMCNNIENRIYTIFDKILRIQRGKLNTQSRRDNFEEWDSLGHILLVEALSKEFKIAISAEEALDMESVEDIKRFIRESTT